MENRLEVTFQNMRSSKTLSAEITKQVAKLERRYGKFISCRVSVEELTKPRRDGGVFEVHIEMQAPHGQLVVTREPHHVRERHASPNALSTLQDAFVAAEAQLRSFRAKGHTQVRKGRKLRSERAEETYRPQ